MSTELEQKTGRITAMLDREGIDAVLLNAQHNFAWLTGGGTNGIDMSRENGAASLLVTRYGRRYILANVIEIQRMLEEEVSAADFDPIDYSWQSEKAVGNFMVETARLVLDKGATLATDLPMDGTTPVIENKIAECRYELTSDELDRYRILGHDAGMAVRRVIDKLDPGETELEIAEELRHELVAGGMTSVVTLVAADERISQFRHPVPTLRRWNKILLLVACAKRHGLIANLSRIICLGDVPDELTKRTEAAAYVNACLLDATRPGATGAELYKTAAAAYAEKDFADEINHHHQGGATGYKTRDWVAHPLSAEVVHVNQAFAWNPSITGTKVEETCIAAADGVEIITASPYFPQIAVALNGREYFSPGILSL